VFENNKWITIGTTEAKDRLLHKARTVLIDYYHQNLISDPDYNSQNLLVTLMKIGLHKEKKFNSLFRRNILQTMIRFRKDRSVYEVNQKETTYIADASDADRLVQ
jgi:hypothetical protein